MGNKQVTIKVWNDTRATLNHIKEITRESLVLIIHRLAADELARLKNLRERTRATWEPTPRPREVVEAEDTEIGEEWLYSQEYND